MTTIDAPQTSAPALAPRRRRRHGSGERAGAGTYVVLAVTAVLFVFPFYYSIVAGSRTPAELFDGTPPVLPGTHLLANMRAALGQADLFTAIGRSLVVSGTVTLATVFFCTLVGFAFAKLRFPGRGALFGVTLATLTIPPTLSIVPLYVVMSELGLLTTWPR